MRLIDADKIEYTHTTARSNDDWHIWNVACVTEDEIVDMPTVDAELVRHGKLIGTEYDGYADGFPVYCEWKCSECGCVFEDEEPTYNYCPYCGAKLDNRHGKPCDDCQEFDCYGCKYAEREEE